MLVDDVTLVVVDVQAAFHRVLPSFSAVVKRAYVCLRAAELLAIPIVATEQYPQGLGGTVSELGLPTVALEKRCFSAAGARGFDLDGRGQVLLCGIETHICIWQTARQLLGEGIDVHVVVDAVGSRGQVDHDVALEAMARVGARLTTAEMALFELLGSAEHPAFKAVQALMRGAMPTST